MDNDKKLLSVGISACLLGHPVRYDGQHTQNPNIQQYFVNHFKLIPFCPETGIGLSVPRPPVQLQGDLNQYRVLGVNNKSTDITDAITRYTKQKASELNVSGCIFKARSPSCGLVTPIFNQNDNIIGYGHGQFVKIWKSIHPSMPIIDETGLADMANRQRFIERVIAYTKKQRTESWF